MLRSLSLLAIVGSIMTSCSSEKDNYWDDFRPFKEETNPAEKVESIALSPTPERKKSVESQYANGIGILGHLLAENGNNSVLVSPFSFHMVASMVANAAGGETAEELLAYLGAADKDVLNNTNHDLMSSVPALDNKVTFEMANSMWPDTELPVRDEFVSTLEDNYSSEIRTVSYGRDDVTGIINSWVKEKTHGMIEYLFEQTNRLSGPVTVVNTLYMKAPWTFPFDVENTFTAPFHTPDGDVQTEFMHSDSMKAWYSSGEFGEKLTLWFGRYGVYQITFVLPKQGVDINAWAGTLTPQSAMQYVQEGNLCEVDVTLPKFGIETEMDLRNILTKMGLSGIFAPSLWTGMTNSPTPLQVGTFIQKVKFTLDESGGEGSAATAAIWISSTGEETPPLEKHVFNADRPFLFMVTEGGCSTPLFMGIVKHP